MYATDSVFDLLTSSHAPLTQGVVSTFTMKFALEQGSGKYSTPILRQFVDKIVSAENNPQWAALATAQSPSYELRRPPAPCAQNILPSTLTPAEWAIITKYYMSLDDEFADLTPRLLFVDGNYCERVPMFNAIHANYDMIIVHDTAPQPISRNYEYHLIDTKYSRYRYGVSTIRGMEIPETTLFTRLPLSDTQLAALKNAIGLAIIQYCAIYAVPPAHYSYTLSKP